MRTRRMSRKRKEFENYRLGKIFHAFLSDGYSQKRNRAFVTLLKQSSEFS